jgi:hypothetical protein
MRPEPFKPETWAECTRHLPVDPKRGLPVPFITPWNDDGTADWRGLDPAKQQACLKGRLCALCGRPMFAWVVFLGDKVSAQPGGGYVEPPLHERCAEATMAGMCPYMSRRDVPWQATDHPAEVLLGDGSVYAGPRRDVVMAYVKSYRLELRPASGAADWAPVYIPAKVARTRRYTWDERGHAAEALDTA